MNESDRFQLTYPIKGEISVMSYLIALDDGHGMTTPGKRTPTFPDGGIMKENEFNRRVVDLLYVELKRCGFSILLVAPTDEDTSLGTRVKRANDAKADFYLSVHANAAGGTWGNAGGIETYAGTSVASKRAARILHRHLIQGTNLKDRGVKDGSWLYMAKHTKMPTVLVECGFMDNRQEAELLRTEAYRQECAVELARGVCEYFSVPYTPEPAVEDDFDDDNIYRLRTGTFASLEDHAKAKQLLKQQYGWVLYDSFDCKFDSTEFRIVTGTFRGIATVTRLRNDLERKFGWTVYIEEAGI
jgi:N-acetylmuramoyl-L-alanine amidase